MFCGSGDAGRRVSGIDAEQSVEHIIRRIAGTTRSQKTVNPGRVVARRDERRLELTAVTDLGVSNSGQEAVAHAFAPEGVGLVAALAEIVLQRLTRATIADGAIRLAIDLAQVAQVADSLARSEYLRVPGSAG